jgi:hypothetical protein
VEPDRTYPRGSTVTYTTRAGARRRHPPTAPITTAVVVGLPLRDVHTGSVWVPVRPPTVPEHAPAVLVRAADIIDISRADQ